MASRVQIPFSFNYPSGGNLVPAAGASIAVYTRNTDGSQGSPASVFQAQSGSSQYSSIQTDTGGNVPGWVAEGTYKIVAAATGGFGGGVINFDALYGGGTSVIAANAVDIPQLSTNAQSFLVPTGTILDHGASTPPAGFLNCDGTVYAQSAYPNLYGSIGSNWNTGGEGSGNFRVPNLIGTMTVGKGTALWGTVRALGKYGLPSGGTYLGEETHALIVGELAVHSHTDAGHSHTDAGHFHGVYDPGHTHEANLANSSSFAAGSAWTGPGTGESYQYINNAYTSISIDTGYASIATNYASIQNTGSGTAHNNMPPFAVVNKIIKY